MKSKTHTLTALTLALLFSAATQAAPAEEPKPAKPRSAQQEKMAMCNKDAKGKKGDERKVFMKSCLSGKAEVVEAAKG